MKGTRTRCEALVYLSVLLVKDQPRSDTQEGMVFVHIFLPVQQLLHDIMISSRSKELLYSLGAFTVSTSFSMASCAAYVIISATHETELAPCKQEGAEFVVSMSMV